MDIIMNDYILQGKDSDSTRLYEVSHGNILSFSKEVVLDLLFEESIYDKFDLEIKGIEDGMLKIQFLEHGKEKPQMGWSLEEFREKCENGDFND